MAEHPLEVDLPVGEVPLRAPWWRQWSGPRWRGGPNVERLLVAAPRQEGLRQVILEAMRAAPIRETARALKLANLCEVRSHVVIEGALGEYSVHLGSGFVHRRPGGPHRRPGGPHRRPGGAICIIAVDSNDGAACCCPSPTMDPKTAEVVSKVLLLANDRQIKDPTISSNSEADSR